MELNNITIINSLLYILALNQKKHKAPPLRLRKGVFGLQTIDVNTAFFLAFQLELGDFLKFHSETLHLELFTEV